MDETSAALQQVVSAIQDNGKLLAAIQQAIKNSVGTYYLPGAWTPTLKGDGTAGAPTYTTQVGTFEQVGRRVTAVFNVVISAIGGMTGNLVIGGLPLASSSAANDLGILSFARFQGVTFSAGYTTLGGIVSPAASTAAVVQSGSNVAPLALPISGVAAATALVGVVSYHV